MRCASSQNTPDGGAMRKPNCSSVDWIEIEIVQIEVERRSVWRCVNVCSRKYRHRSEYSRKLLPAICPYCHERMKLIEKYWQVKPVNHLPNGEAL
jgi:predicted metal-binding protein